MGLGSSPSGISQRGEKERRTRRTGRGEAGAQQSSAAEASFAPAKQQMALLGLLQALKDGAAYGGTLLAKHP